ncbi:MAG: rhomboid family intramembrane serine protease [Gammaproteobacteria bacterium]|nr:rhomboid family intramembrane serine protease [Gammaproteobacteria bacterium]MDH5650686.1 rhomboid family intramembrane serine protease [Gammaproteobacteria bacterium]
MFPIGDDNPQINTPIATYVIIGLNALAWLLLQGMGSGSTLNASVCQYGLIPADLFGAMEAAKPVCPPGSGWSGLLTSMFMHGSWMHILGNMWFLWVFGDNVEDSMGSVRFAIFYVLCGLGAAAAQILSNVHSTIPMVGASGAIGGVMGAYLMLYPRVKVHLLVFIITFRVPAVAMLGYWIAVQLLGGFSSLHASGGGVAFWAHVGGFAAGALLILVMKDDELLVKHEFHGWSQSADPAGIWDDPANRQ